MIWKTLKDGEEIWKNNDEGKKQEEFHHLKLVQIKEEVKRIKEKIPKDLEIAYHLIIHILIVEVILLLFLLKENLLVLLKLKKEIKTNLK